MKKIVYNLRIEKCLVVMRTGSRWRFRMSKDSVLMIQIDLRSTDTIYGLSLVVSQPVNKELYL